MKEYKIWISTRTNIKVLASSRKEAKELAWREIEDGFTYGWTKEEFLKSATVEEV
jgi:hypothetical protein